MGHNIVSLIQYRMSHHIHILTILTQHTFPLSYILFNTKCCITYMLYQCAFLLLYLNMEPYANSAPNTLCSILCP